MKITPTLTLCTQADACPAWLIHGDCEHAQDKPGSPVLPAVDRRALALISEAQSALTQMRYEGSHTVRQDPAPTVGSPWTHPDLPAPVRAALDEAINALNALSTVARYEAARQADPSAARR